MCQVSFTRHLHVQDLKLVQVGYMVKICHEHQITTNLSDFTLSILLLGELSALSVGETGQHCLSKTVCFYVMSHKQLRLVAIRTRTVMFGQQC